MNLSPDTIIQSDALKGMKQLPDACCDMLLTSPPYYGLRDYGIKGQLGLEASPQAYIQNLLAVFKEAKRVLKNEATLWVNIADSYRGTEKRKGSKVHKKSMLGIPFLFASGMVEQGWILRNTIIWQKPNAMPESAKDRFTNDFEYLFFFSKSPKYYFKQQFEPYLSNEYDQERMRKGRKAYNGKWSKTKIRNKLNMQTEFVSDNSEGRNKRAVWNISTQAFKEAHFAVFPEELIELPIMAACPEKGLVLDPFMGSGTTGLVAKKQGKHYLGIELNPKFIYLTKKRINDTNTMKQVAGIRKPRKIDQKGYKYYVYNPATNKLLSGWEYREDAQDHVRELSFIGLKVYTKTFLKRLDINPANNSDWGTDRTDNKGLKGTMKSSDLDKVYKDFLFSRNRAFSANKSDTDILELVLEKQNVIAGEEPEKLLTKLFIRFSQSKLPSRLFSAYNKLNLEYLIKGGQKINPQPIPVKINEAGKDFDKIVKSFSRMVAKDKLRRAMEGVYLNSGCNELAATNAHLLLTKPYKLSGESLIIDPNTKPEKADKKATLYKDKYLIIQGKYPKYKQVIPTYKAHSKRIDIKEILAQVKGVERLSGFFLQKQDFMIRLIVDKHDIWFKPALLLKLLTSMAELGTKQIQFSWADKAAYAKPVLIKSIQEPKMNSLVMPFDTTQGNEHYAYLEMRLDNSTTKEKGQKATPKEQPSKKALSLRARAIKIKLELMKL